MGPIFQTCLLCHSPRVREMAAYRKDHLCRCRDCGFVFSRQKPSDAELELVYSAYTYHREYYVSPITLKRYREILAGFEKYRKLNTLLDVGCGNGLFLSVARDMGWQVFGTEYSAKAVEICRANGLDVRQGKLKDLASDLPEIDVVVSIEVIEHIQWPRDEVQTIREKLRAGGALYLTTPNFNALMRYWQRGSYIELTYPEHLSYYTPRTLKRLMTDNGFSVKSFQCSGFSFSYLQNAISSGAENPFTAGSTDEKLREKLEQGGWLKYAKSFVNFILDISGTGNALKGLFEKSG